MVNQDQKAEDFPSTILDMNKDSVMNEEDQIQQSKKSDSPKGVEGMENGDGLDRMKTMGAAVTDDFYNFIQSGETEKLTGNQILQMNELYGQRE